MIARVKHNGKGKFIIQFKGTFFGFQQFWWTTHYTIEANYDGGTYSVPIVYETEEEATKALIELVLKDEKKKKNAEKTSVILEVTTEEVRDKLAEHFI